MPTTAHELPNPAEALLAPFEEASTRPNRLRDRVAQYEAEVRAQTEQRIEEVLDSAWKDGHHAGTRKGYVKGWRTGLIDGTLAGALLVAGALWLGHHFTWPAWMQGLLP